MGPVGSNTVELKGSTTATVSTEQPTRTDSTDQLTRADSTEQPTRADSTEQPTLADSTELATPDMGERVSEFSAQVGGHKILKVRRQKSFKHSCFFKIMITLFVLKSEFY